jgi:hypothetical protein
VLASDMKCYDVAWIEETQKALLDPFKPFDPKNLFSFSWQMFSLV